MTEKQITNKIIQAINSQDNMWCYKRFGCGHGNNKGMPDITGISNGIRLEIEVKDPNRLPSKHREETDIETLLAANLLIASKLQQYYVKKYKKLGAIAGVVTSVEEAMYLVGLR